MAHTTRILVAGIVMAGALVSAKHSEAAEPQDNAAAARPRDRFYRRRRPNHEPGPGDAHPPGH